MVFQIKDTGIGMAPETIPYLFEPFVQADDSLTREQGGTGLGLSISKHLCEMMAGDIHVESQPGVGSTFTVRIPVELEEQSVIRYAGEEA
jgi:hypothetical protein